MKREEFVKLWGDKYLGVLMRAAAAEKNAALYARWLSLQVVEIDAWLGTLHDAIEAAPPRDEFVAPAPTVQKRWALRALLAIWSKVVEPAMHASATEGPMKELPAPLLQWLANADNRKAVADWLKHEEGAARGASEAA